MNTGFRDIHSNFEVSSGTFGVLFDCKHFDNDVGVVDFFTWNSRFTNQHL